MEYITMNRKELEQAKMFEQVKQGTITKTEAARRLGITNRWVRAKVNFKSTPTGGGFFLTPRGGYSQR